MKHRRISCALLAAGSVTAMLAADAASAGGFALRERSAKAQGSSFASSTAGASDVTFSLFNPAALRAVESNELGGALSVVIPDTDGNVRAVNQSADPGEIGIVPATAYGHRVNENLVFGVGLHSPFGLTTEYDGDFAGQGDGLKSQLITVALTPMIAWNIDPSITIGAGASLIYNKAELTTGLGGGRVNKLTGDDIAFAGSLGALVDVTDTTTIGLAFRSGYTFDVNASDGEFTGFLPGLGATVLPGTAAINLPSTVSFGVAQDITEDFRLFGEVEWANWSVFDDIEVAIITPVGAVDGSEVTRYDDSIFVALGGEYDMDDALTLRAGVAYDTTPTTDADRSVRIPDGDRIWLSAGASYDISETMSVDAGYSLLLFEDNTAILKNGPLAGTAVDFEGMAHILAIGGTFRF